jgi:hypothetical protein
LGEQHVKFSQVAGTGTSQNNCYDVPGELKIILSAKNLAIRQAGKRHQVLTQL